MFVYWFSGMIFLEVVFRSESFTVPELFTPLSGLFLCCTLVTIWRELSRIIPEPWVAMFTSGLEATYNGVCTAGTKVKEYVLEVYHRF